jgi:hypothetical protein
MLGFTENVTTLTNMNESSEVHNGEWVLYAQGIATGLPDEAILGRVKAKTLADLKKARSKALASAKKKGASINNLRVTAILTSTESRAISRRPYKVSFTQNENERPMLYVDDLEYWRERIKPKAKRFSEKN